MELTHNTHTFGPEYHSDSRILILGSFPSVKSRAANFYYGHPQNRFWKLISEIFWDANIDEITDETAPLYTKKDIADAPTEENIPAKKAFLERHHIALWDSIEECDINGSSDSSIRNVVPVDIRKILDNSTVERIFVNGKTSEKYYNKYLEPICGRTAICLPSSSPANAAWKFDALLAEWKRLLTPGIIPFEPTENLDFYRDRDYQDGYLDLENVDLPVIRFHSLDKLPGIEALFTTRLGGVSKGDLASLNLGLARGATDEDLEENYRRVAEILHADVTKIAMTSQTHTVNVKRVELQDDLGNVDSSSKAESLIEETNFADTEFLSKKTNLLFDKKGNWVGSPALERDIDGLYTTSPGVTLSATFADCVPVYICDPTHGKIALVHSGWRGTVGKISQIAVEKLVAEGSAAEDLVCVIGPSISGQNYEVTGDVIQEIDKMFPEDAERQADIYHQTDKIHYHLDLWAAIWYTLRDAGVQEENIHFSGICTYDNASLLFSHRRTHGMRGNVNAFLMQKYDIKQVLI